MKKRTKKILIWSASIIGVGIIVYVGLMGYVYFSFFSGCGMDDGPFTAVLVDPVVISDSAKTIELRDGGILVLENRNDTLSPILTYIENNEILWTLDTDVRNTKGYETCRIWEISNVTVTKDTDPIRFNFAGHWTYGVEAGFMEIDRKDGKNSFCLSW